MISDPRMGTLVVASAGVRRPRPQQVISQRDRTDKGVVFLWTGSRDAKGGLPMLKTAQIPIFYTPDKLARGLQSRLAYHTWRERRLADGFATAPPRTAAQDTAIAQALGLGRPTLSGIREQAAAIGRLGRGEWARASGQFRGGSRRGRGAALGFPVAPSRSIFAGHPAQDGGRNRSAEPRRCGAGAHRLRAEIIGQLPRPMPHRPGSAVCRCRRW